MCRDVRTLGMGGASLQVSFYLDEAACWGGWGMRLWSEFDESREKMGGGRGGGEESRRSAEAARRRALRLVHRPQGKNGANGEWRMEKCPALALGRTSDADNASAEADDAQQPCRPRRLDRLRCRW